MYIQYRHDMLGATMNDAVKIKRDVAAQAALKRINKRVAGITQRDNTPAGKAGEIIIELERRLTNGQYLFGDALSINALADELDASRQPISIAINHLRALGYVSIVPQVGCRVVSPSATEIDDFFYLLAKMESAMAGLAAARHNGDEADVLMALAAEISKTPFDVAEHREHYARAVDAYHDLIREMARSPALVPRVSDLWRLADFYMWQGAGNFAPPKVSVANRERYAIAKAVRAGNVAESEQLMEIHVRGKPRRVGIV